MASTQYQGTGRRKSSVARVWLRPGSGQIRINGREFERYFTTPALQLLARSPLQSLELSGQFDVHANIDGGGLAGQSGALRLGIARALLAYNAELRPRLRGLGLLTRDARVKERKKYGQKGARKRFQFSKR